MKINENKALIDLIDQRTWEFCSSFMILEYLMKIKNTNENKD